MLRIGSLKCITCHGSRVARRRKSLDFRLVMSLAYGNGTLISFNQFVPCTCGLVDHLHEAKLRFRSDKKKENNKTAKTLRDVISQIK